jgi:hypothetical protein
LDGRCSFVRPNGERCKLPVTGQLGVCWAHDPKNAEQRRRTASRGGRGRASREIVGLKAQLQDIADGVLKGTTQPKNGAVAVQALSALLRALEQERRQRELEDIVQRLEQLEQRYNSGGVRSWG